MLKTAHQKKERMTSQKKIILDFLKDTRTHPSVEMAYKEVRKKLPRISKATVYRILRDLKKKGEISEIPCKVCRYDGDPSTHAHFVCDKCGSIFDIFGELSIKQPKKIKAGKVKNYQICFYGVCKNCQKK